MNRHKHLAFTGTKQGCTAFQHEQLQKLFKQLRNEGFLWMHNGDCVGADLTAATLWTKVQGRVILHPPTNSSFQAHFQTPYTLPKADYITRDRHMVDMASLLVATPLTSYEEIRSGTWTTVRYGRKHKIKTIVITPS